MIPIRIKAIHAQRAREADSPKKTIPAIAVPAAPIPVQTAYPVPTGISFNPRARKTKLAIIAATVNTLGQRRVNPSVLFNPSAQTTSSTPAFNTHIQAIAARAELQKPRQLPGPQWAGAGC